jgi:hypothetical protein
MAESKSAEYVSKVNEFSEFSSSVRPLIALVNFLRSECRLSCTALGWDDKVQGASHETIDRRRPFIMIQPRYPEVTEHDRILGASHAAAPERWSNRPMTSVSRSKVPDHRYCWPNAWPAVFVRRENDRASRSPRRTSTGFSTGR